MKFRNLTAVLLVGAAAACATSRPEGREPRSRMSRRPAMCRTNSAGSTTRTPSATVAPRWIAAFRDTAAFAARWDGPENVYL